MTAQEDFQAFLDAQKVEDYTLGDITGTKQGDQDRYTELKISVMQEEAKVERFNKAKEDAFSELNKRHNEEKIALSYMTEAYHTYRMWGANAKVRHIEEKYPNLIKLHTKGTGPSLISSKVLTTSTTASLESIDLTTVIKASQARPKTISTPA